MNGLSPSEIIAVIHWYAERLRNINLDTPPDDLQLMWDRVDTMVQALKVYNRIGNAQNG